MSKKDEVLQHISDLVGKSGFISTTGDISFPIKLTLSNDNIKADNNFSVASLEEAESITLAVTQTKNLNQEANLDLTKPLYLCKVGILT